MKAPIPSIFKTRLVALVIGFIVLHFMLVAVKDAIAWECLVAHPINVVDSSPLGEPYCHDLYDNLTVGDDGFVYKTNLRHYCDGNMLFLDNAGLQYWFWMGSHWAWGGYVVGQGSTISEGLLANWQEPFDGFTYNPHIDFPNGCSDVDPCMEQRNALINECGSGYYLIDEDTCEGECIPDKDQNLGGSSYGICH